MNAYRILMIVLGFAVIIPESIFFFTLRQGKGALNVLIGRALRLQAVAIALMAVGIIWRFLANPHAGVATSTQDHVFSLLVSFVAAVACWRSLYVFFKVRTPTSKPQEAKVWIPPQEQQSPPLP